MGVLLGLSSGSMVVVWMAGGPAIGMGDSGGPGRASRRLMAWGTSGVPGHMRFLLLILTLRHHQFKTTFY